MANFIKCECCGGEMLLLADNVTAECEYCGRRTVWREPKGETLVMEMNRANSYRLANKFSDAIMSYRLITEKNPKDAEAWWGLTLSTYGIEYVKDPRGGYVPTCHRTVREGIFENGDYQNAYRYAAESQREEYAEEAKEIDRLQKEILRLADAGEDYDVFISFKSKDKSGRMTRDAKIARTVYDELTKRGIKTFFSDVTLQGKLFSDYEPIIYRALISCKYFILVGTSDEYIHSEWVTNEWSRFEERMEREKLSGVACAVFDGGAVKNLPEFLRAQGADLRNYPAGGYEIHVADAVEAKMGRKKRSREEEEILRQIEAQKKAQRELEERLKGIQSSGTSSAPQRGASATVDSLLLRAEQELESGNYDEANSYYNRVLDADPKNAEAWWGLFLAGERIGSAEKYDLSPSPEKYSALMNNRNYLNAKRYAMGNFKEEIENFDKSLVQNTELMIQKNDTNIEKLTIQTNEFPAGIRPLIEKCKTKKKELNNKLLQQEKKLHDLRCDSTGYEKKANARLIPDIMFEFYLFPFLPIAVLISPILAIVRAKNRKIFNNYSQLMKTVDADIVHMQSEIKRLEKQADEYEKQIKNELTELTRSRNVLEEENKFYKQFLNFLLNGENAKSA